MKGYIVLELDILQ